MTMDNLTLILAQDGASDVPVAAGDVGGTATIESAPAAGGTALDSANGGETAAAQGLPTWVWLLPIAMLLIMFSTGGRKEKKKRAAMMASMGKGDKVQTVGGILGTVVEVRDDEIVVKVDENANTRLRFSRTAIQSILESKNAD